MKIEYSPKFFKRYSKLPKEVKVLAEEKEKIFRKDSFDIRLKTHKLSGKLKNYWAFSVNFNTRIIFSFKDKDLIRFHTIGDHDLYK
ncbi:MAG TPA: type II toxin-antitoxin system mRNA interferase toxin, RelE/StbE family [Candidatus Paceibacterota bacterium]|jgi:mRNA-degrading endonuclease YafQ of YafQ-DinJ toxin-antitoxin module|nr:type II toxin-antitoxin system mRNA interferase toxin, RelE/StbE family [Candidatus Paceibacterota bacterium]HOO47933.1 type II toxin-antitoxin system mRNA interferase toxin, RelE/StbE family [Candidatus Paceibacterota bacterium]HOX91112.1 type II toxin-antitoxin system mRNA interferase toxin, RelE/StbE family [Candidatus Paceibacterota bacterium]HPC12540.1 type II toxin-antitoxin system mRNA interferase toxin, RelE/StbE family [Candidatus Paceibacterota bacterium]HPI66655.1 type II toxin-an